MSSRVWKAYCDDAGEWGGVDDIKAFRAWVREHKRWRGRELAVMVKLWPRIQGDAQMRYYRGGVIPAIAIACGEPDPDEYETYHQAMAWKFLRLPDGRFGEPRRRSTSKDDLSMEEMSAYLDQVITWAHTSIVGCHIMTPEEYAMSEAESEAVPA